MTYIDVLAETGIELLWLPVEFEEQGIYIARCPQFINGAIGIRLGMDEIHTEITAYHEIGHLVEGDVLFKINSILKHLKNEAKANRYMIHEKAVEWLHEIEFLATYFTPDRFLERFGLSVKKFYDMAKQEMAEIVKEYEEQLIY